MTTAPDPPPPASLDVPAMRGFHRLRWIVVACTALVFIIAVTVLSYLAVRQQRNVTRIERIAARQQQEVLANCKFWADLAPQPATTLPGKTKPTRVSVALIIDSRRAFLGERCPGTMPPPSESLARGAAIYHLRIPG